MTLSHYVLWFVLQAAATIVVLVVGTLGAADLLRRPGAERSAARPGATPLPVPAGRAGGEPTGRDRAA